ncbi:MAG: DUF1833 domain-containing protein [Desulfuromonadales bacterium]|nr:DUF1833 domain-containing protein [Desulfuromonadales bacterium]
MRRNLSLTAREAIYAQQTDQVFLLLLTIDHADLTTPIRVANNNEAIVSRGDNYVAYPFQINLPPDRDEQISQVTLSIDNVDRQIVQAVRSLGSSPSVSLEVILASDPNYVEAGPFDFSLKSVDYDALTVSGTLGFEDLLNEPFPGDTFSPAEFPGLF